MTEILKDSDWVSKVKELASKKDLSTQSLNPAIAEVLAMAERHGVSVTEVAGTPAEFLNSCHEEGLFLNPPQRRWWQWVLVATGFGLLFNACLALRDHDGNLPVDYFQAIFTVEIAVAVGLWAWGWWRLQHGSRLPAVLSFFGIALSLMVVTMVSDSQKTGSLSDAPLFSAPWFIWAIAGILTLVGARVCRLRWPATPIVISDNATWLRAFQIILFARFLRTPREVRNSVADVLSDQQQLQNGASLQETYGNVASYAAKLVATSSRTFKRKLKRTALMSLLVLALAVSSLVRRIETGEAIGFNLFAVVILAIGSFITWRRLFSSQPN